MESSLSEVNFDFKQCRKSVLKGRIKQRKTNAFRFYILHIAVQNLEKIEMANKNLIENQPLLKIFFKRPPIMLNH